MDHDQTVQISNVLRGLQRCPHCNIARPEMTVLWKSDCIIPSNQSGYGHNWATYKCNSCCHVVLAQSELGNQSTTRMLKLFPAPEDLPNDLPERVRIYLRQAIESIHSPDGSVMLAGAAVDAMLKLKGLNSGSVYSRIDEAVKKHILTPDMASWAHEVRLGSNRPRHADTEQPHVSENEAKQAVEFTRMLGHLLFVLPAKIEKGLQGTKTEVGD